ncbi:hypothetical protein EYC80_003081 [Monilinia laxa]|uniref:Uncharacterized protein n=1 Tax=Monilinia laxa TaxID=61186 RepID=A0A5N6KCR3_MONLA|nr:hypothetical protein EYC80_003081 [Monilinia laxa]
MYDTGGSFLRDPIDEVVKSFWWIIFEYHHFFSRFNEALLTCSFRYNRLREKISLFNHQVFRSPPIMALAMNPTSISLASRVGIT